VFLQLNTANSFVYLKFLELQYPMSYYAFYASSTIQSLHISGYLFPHLNLSWPNLLIKNNTNGKTIQWPRRIRLSHQQANTLRTALMPSHAENIKPLFHYYRTGMTGPVVLQTDSGSNDSADAATEPSAPVGMQHADIELRRLYPIV